MVGLSKKRPVERLKVGLRWLIRPAAEEGRKAHLPALNLPLVEQLRPGKGEDRNGRGPGLFRGKKCRGPGFVVVFQKTDKSVLVRMVCQEMQPHFPGISVLHPVGMEFSIPAGLRSQTPMSHKASKPCEAMASHSVSGTVARFTDLLAFRLSSPSHTQVLIS